MQQEFQRADAPKKRILLVATGGTIASQESENGLTPGLGGNDLLKAVPEAGAFCQVDTVQVINIDSTNIQPEQWLLIARAIEEHYDQYDGFVVSHGTDTMAYTASMLSYLIQNPQKPIVLTGAQKPIEEGITDARKNLADSFCFCAQDGVKGVYIVFNGEAIVGTRARKMRTKSYGAYESVNFPVAAYIDGDRVTRHFSLQDEPGGETAFYRELCPSVCLLKLIPGLEPDILDYAAQRYDAIVIESYGVGGLPFAEQRNFLEKVEKLTAQGKIVVVTTQVMLEGTDLEVYEVGVKALSGGHLLQGYDMTAESIVTKLLWILARTRNFEEVRELFYRPVNHDLQAAF